MSNIDHLEAQIDTLIAHCRRLEHENGQLLDDNQLLARQKQELEQSYVNLQQCADGAINKLNFVISDLKEKQVTYG